MYVLSMNDTTNDVQVVYVISESIMRQVVITYHRPREHIPSIFKAGCAVSPFLKTFFHTTNENENHCKRGTSTRT